MLWSVGLTCTSPPCLPPAARRCRLPQAAALQWKQVKTVPADASAMSDNAISMFGATGKGMFTASLPNQSAQYYTSDHGRQALREGGRGVSCALAGERPLRLLSRNNRPCCHRPAAHDHQGLGPHRHNAVHSQQGNLLQGTPTALPNVGLTLPLPHPSLAAPGPRLATSPLHKST